MLAILNLEHDALDIILANFLLPENDDD